MIKKHTILSIGLFILTLLGLYLFVAMGHRDGKMIFEFDWPKVFFSNQSSRYNDIIISLRFPRAVAALLTGSALGLSGLLLQGVTRNPLADPFLLGISGGAGLGVVLINAFSITFLSFGFWVIPVTAFAGAQIATILVMFLARGTSKKISLVGMVLAGVIINAFCAAFTTFLLMQFDPLKMKVTSLWLAGGIGYFKWGELLFAGVIIVFAAIFIRVKAVSLNALALGEEGAQVVGVDSKKVLEQSAWTASLLTGVAVALGGLIGYVGLIVPHIVRMIFGRDFKNNIFFSALTGGLLLLTGDALARTLLSPEEIPVGIIAALLGTPVLLILLKRELSGDK
ncbi:MAG: iron ABC transporter permease [Deltaproteobacteria bacterium]|nr:iron ABC transporter permease [Deltaproteobacteria bacterium]